MAILSAPMILVPILCVILSHAWTEDEYSQGCDYAPWLGRYTSHDQEQEMLHVPTNHGSNISIFTAEFANLPIDHLNASLGTYRNRYWVNDQFYQPGGPVFVHDVGENDAQASAHRYLGQPSSYLLDMLQEFGGIGLVWEHRFFGDSVPYPINVTTPWEYLKPLTYKQALADLPYFSQTFRRSSFKQDLSPSSTAWVMIGCSYSGIRAALSRDVYPEVFFAAYASSAPVEARVNFHTYFDQVYSGMTGYGYGNCSRDLHSIIEYIDLQLSRGHGKASAIKQLFLGPGAEAQHTSDGDFALALAYTFRFFQSRGMGKVSGKSGASNSLAALCDYLEQDLPSQSYAIMTDPTSKSGAEHLTERFASWPPWLKSINRDFNTNCRSLNESLPPSCDLHQTQESDPAMIAWAWLLCTEWGFFTGHNPGPNSIVSRYLNPKYHQNLCFQQFPGARKAGGLPWLPRAEQLNLETGGQTMRPSHTFWTVGEYDPWRELGPLSTGNMAKDPNILTSKIPECNSQTDTKKIFGHVIPDTQHCHDFTAGSESGRRARSHFTKALKEWLKCYAAR